MTYFTKYKTPKAFSTGIVSEFRAKVFAIMQEIPYGKTACYKDIAERIARERSAGTCKSNTHCEILEHGHTAALPLSKMSAQAVGGAVGANPICIIIPCHRILGKDGSMTGYGGGIKNKIALLRLEQRGEGC